MFCPLTLNYLFTWGNDLWEDAPYNLLTYFTKGKPTREGEEVVIIIKVLASDFNNGYDNLVNLRILEVNGKKIRNLRELIHAIEKGTEEPFVVFKTAGDQTIAIDRQKAEAARGEILSVYRIGEDRSSDLKAVASDDNAGGKMISGTHSTEAVTLKQ